MGQTVLPWAASDVEDAAAEQECVSRLHVCILGRPVTQGWPGGAVTSASVPGRVQKHTRVRSPTSAERGPWEPSPYTCLSPAARRWWLCPGARAGMTVPAGGGPGRQRPRGQAGSPLAREDPRRCAAARSPGRGQLATLTPQPGSPRSGRQGRPAFWPLCATPEEEGLSWTTR